MYYTWVCLCVCIIIYIRCDYLFQLIIFTFSEKFFLSLFNIICSFCFTYVVLEFLFKVRLFSRAVFPISIL